MKKGLIVIFILFNFQFIGKKAELYAQPSFSVDTTFQPFFDVTDRFGFGDITRIWENPFNGGLHLAGDFRLFLGNDPFYSLLSTHRDGSRNFNFIGYTRSGMSFFYPINDTVFISGNGGGGTTSPWISMAIMYGPIGG